MIDLHLKEWTDGIKSPSDRIGYVLSGQKNAQLEGVIYGKQTEQSIISFRIPRPRGQGWVEI